jgi:DNA repair exonuclease SbcCD ATPase subunit
VSKKIRWQRLVLRGFGRFAGEVEVTFHPGLNHAVAPNERGKSTLVAGLAAVLFGLPASSDPARRGKARYRNWAEPERFEGEVYFSVDGTTYRVQRDFDSDRVTLSRKDGDRWTQLAGGEHRARARKRNLTYEESLADLIGIASADLFWSTFCVGQPLPEPGQISHSVQQLLAGAGATGAEALAFLEEHLEKKTRYTGRLGVTGRDKNKDRELERLQEEKRNLEQALKESAASVDAQHALQQELSRLEQEKKDTQDALTAKEGLYQGWNRWRLLRDQYEAALKEQVKLEEAREQAAQLERQLALVNAGLAEEYKEFQEAPPGVKDRLDELLATAEELKRLQAESEGLEQRIEDLRAESRALEEKLHGPLAAAVRRPHLVRDHQELVRRLAEARDLAARLADLERRAREAEAVLEEVQTWAALGDRPLDFYRRTARAALEKYEGLQARARALAAKQKELAERYGFFAAAPPELLAQCRDYHTLAREREGAKDRAQAALKAAEAKLLRQKQQEEKLKQQFADVADLPPDSAALLDEKLALAAARQRLEEKAAAQRQKAGGTGFWVAGAALLVAAAVFWAAGHAAGLALALLAAGAGLWIYGTAAGRRRAPAADPERARVAAALEALDARLGSLAALPLPELAARRERLRLWEEQRRELTAAAADLPTEDELAALREQAARAEKDLESFREELAPVCAQFADPQAAYLAWQGLVQAVAELEKELTGAAERDFGRPAAQIAAAPLESVALWQDLQPLAEAVGRDVPTVGDAVRWLEALTPGEWESWRRAAERYRAAEEELRTLGIQRAELEKPDATGKSQREQLEAGIQALRAAIHPFNENTPAAEIAGLVAACREAEQELQEKLAVVKNETDNLAKLQEKLRALQEKEAGLRQELAPILAPAGGSAAAAKARWLAWQEKETVRQGLASRLEGLLKGQGAASLTDLSAKALDAANTALAIKREWENLIAGRPGLPSTAQAQERAELEKEYSALERARAELAQKKKALEDDIYAKNKELSALLGRRVINIAAAQDRLKELEDECARLELEAEALALAHRELAAARDEFSAAYRERLARRASEYFAAFTRVPGRQVLFDTEFDVSIAEPDGRVVAIAQLSQGAQDQLQIALRLAIADLVAGNFNLPLICDDPFLNFDSERLAQLQATLTGLGKERQVILLSHQETYRTWGEPLQFCES